MLGRILSPVYYFIKIYLKETSFPLFIYTSLSKYGQLEILPIAWNNCQALIKIYFPPKQLLGNKNNKYYLQIVNKIA